MKSFLDFFARIVPECNGPCGFCEFLQMLQNLINFLTFSLAIPLATLAIILGGFWWIFSGGSEERVEKGRKAIWGGVLGLIITFCSWLLINFFLNMLSGENLTKILGHPWHKIECP